MAKRVGIQVGPTPANDRTPVTYSTYLSLEGLLGLQKLRSKPRQHDEVLFIIAHQAYELWFKLMLNELETAISEMIAGNLPEATRLIRRVTAVQRVLIEQLDVLETIRPADFMKFRSVLNPASGFQSLQFRELEFISGAKDEKFLSMHARDEGSHEQLLKRWDAPSLWDAFVTALSKTDSGRKGKSARSELKSFDDQVSRVTALFSNGKPVELTELAESMMEYDKFFWLWRNHHIAMVERVIGKRPGTGKDVIYQALGTRSFQSSGVSYLQGTLTKRFFPVLWEARTRIGES